LRQVNSAVNHLKMKIEIIKTTLKEIEVVHRYMNEIFALELVGLSIRPKGITLEETKKYLPEQSNSQEKLCALAFVRNKVVGQIAFSRYEKFEYRHGGSFGMSVVPEFWRRGIGTLLITYLEEWIIINGLLKIDLNVWSNNLAAIKMYEKLGYTHEGCRKSSIIRNGKEIDLILMGKLLQNRKGTIVI